MIMDEETETAAATAATTTMIEIRRGGDTRGGNNDWCECAVIDNQSEQSHFINTLIADLSDCRSVKFHFYFQCEIYQSS